jgi:hypothetical protein
MDHIQNNGETQVDCGEECGAICESHCWDGLQNSTETGVDCGGSCKRCDGPQNGVLEVAAGGSALLKISVAPTASTDVIALAKVLQRKLKAITNADFTIVYDGSRGIRLGVPGDFAEWPYAMNSATPPQSVTFSSPSSFDREDYVIRSIPSWGTLALAGGNRDALENAVWGLLDALGYRHYLPSPIWEIVPKLPTLNVDLDERVHPAFAQRGIQYSSRAWPLAEDPTTDPYSGQPYVTSADCKAANGSSLSYEVCALDLWRRRNRMTGVELSAGDNWDGVKTRALVNHPGLDPAIFWQTPAAPNMPCISAQQIINGQTITAELLAKEFTTWYFQQLPTAASISMEAGDEGVGTAGAPWCAADAAAGLTKSDVVVRMANAAAQNLPDANRHVVIRSYSTHSEAPNVVVHPRVFVQFYQTNLFQPLIDGWKAKYGAADPARLFGVRTRYTTSSEQPGSSIGARPDLVAKTIQDFHAQHANGTYEVETYASGVTGFGQWLASRLLWDPNQSVSQLRAEFLLNSFGPARFAMDTFYSYLASPTLSTHWINNAYRRLSEALNAVAADTTLPADERTKVQQRIRDQAVYVRYLDMRRGLVSDCLYTSIYAPGQPVPSNADRLAALLQLSYATRTSLLLPSGLFFSSTCPSVGADSLGCVKPSASVVDAIKSAANAAPVTASQVETWITEGAARPVLQYTDTSGVLRDLPVDRESPFDVATLVPKDAPEPPTRVGNGTSDNAGLMVTRPVIEDSDSGVGRWYVWPTAGGDLSPLMVTGCLWCNQTPGSAHFYAAASYASAGAAPAAPFWSIQQFLTSNTHFNVGNPAGGAGAQLYALDVRGAGQDSARTCTSDPNQGQIDENNHASGDNSNTCSARMVRLATATDSNRFTSSYDSLFAVPRETRSVAGFAAHLTQVYRWYKSNQNSWVRTCVKVPAYTLSQCSGVAEHFSIPNQSEVEDCGAPNSGSNPQSWPVPQPAGDMVGQAQLWKLRDANGQIALLTVPPVLARHPREFLLPSDALVP